jgi:gluconolactonase
MGWILIAVLAVVGTEAEFTTGPVELVADGFGFTEGPLWLPSGKLVFSDIPKDTIYHPDKTVFLKPSGNSNGLVLDTEDRIIACEHGNRRVSRTEKDGTVRVLADAYQGKKLNSPNDAVVRSDGVVFFTDPPYGLQKRKRELPFNGVFAIMTDGALKLLAEDFDRPNGIALSPDEKTLYVADTEGSHIRAFGVARDGALSEGRVWCEIPHPDGMKVDERGNVWCTAEDGVRVMNPDGKLVETVPCPQIPANCAFGGPGFDTLYITARTGLYKVACAVKGLPPARR